MRYILLLFTTILLFTSCQKTQTAPASAEAKHYPIKGKIVSVDKANKKVKLDHEAIPGFMEAMTMDFPIHEDWVWNDLMPGAEVHAELVVDSSAKDPYWLEKIGIVALPNPNQPAVPINEKFAQIGKEVPDFSLTNQNGKKFSLKDYRGKALAITFIYRECPLPEFCVKMSKYFSDMANQIASDPAGKEKIRLLSISFDPERDTPEKLKQYGLGYLGKDAKDDFTVWQLAVGPDKDVKAIADFFGLRYETDATDKTQINHSLITAVISPEGKVTRIFSGGNWTPEEVMSELQSMARIVE
ncbi:MAG: redoxin domain-containing protein [Acidobacteria bacterium]|nr:redoxin domain-containing protein [Acidobacteriota bacterium]